MFDFKALDSAKTDSDKNHDKSEEEYNETLAEAYKYFKTFETGQDLSDLYKSAELFGKCLEVKSQRAEPYYNLAVIFYMIGNSPKALEYFQSVQELEPAYPGLNKSLLMINEDKNN